MRYRLSEIYDSIIFSLLFCEMNFLKACIRGQRKEFDQQPFQLNPGGHIALIGQRMIKRGI